MIIRVGLTHTRSIGPYETNRYSIDIEDNVRDNEIDDPRVTSQRLFAVARQIVLKQKEQDGIR